MEISNSCAKPIFYGLVFLTFVPDGVRDPLVLRLNFAPTIEILAYPSGRIRVAFAYDKTRAFDLRPDFKI
jgi:hypothetical protein